MRIIAFIASCIFSVAGANEPSPQSRLSMAKEFAQDPDKATFLCGGSPCSAQEVESLVEYNCDRAGPTVDFCILEPKKKARNMYIGVFARKTGSEYKSQFIFFGSGIGLTASTHLGARDMSGREIEEGGSFSSYQYCWNGDYYVSLCPIETGR